MKFADISSDESGQERGSQKRLQQNESGKSSPLKKITSMVDLCEEEKTASAHSASAIKYMDSRFHQSFPEEVFDSEEEAPLQTHWKNAYSATADQRESRSQSFPEKLVSILSHEEYSDSIRWLPHGKSFEIINPDKFHSQVLPLFFKNCKQKSFTRKLYRWGFRQITKGPDANSFFNENFSREGIQVSKMHCHYSKKELRVRNQKMIQCSQLKECSSISSSESPKYSCSHSRSSSQSIQNPPSMQDSTSVLHKISTSDLSSLLSISAAPFISTPSTNVTSPQLNLLRMCSSVPLLPNLPFQSFFPAQNMGESSITNQCGNPEQMLSAVIANMNLQQRQALLQLVELKVQEAKARLIAGLEASITNTASNDNKATLQLLLDKLHETQQRCPW